MSSKILNADIPVEPLRWRAASSSSPSSEPEPKPPWTDNSGHANPKPPFDHHNPADEARIRELESTIKLLEPRVEDERRNSREQGHREGFAEGLEAGIQQEAAKWADALARLARSIEDMSKSKARFRAEVEEDAVKLALAIARKVLNRELSTDPEALAGLARVALDKLNLRELQRVRVHPADAQAIGRVLGASSGPKRVEVVADGTLERGGAIFETDRGMLDASVTTQLGEIERGLADMLGTQPK